VFVGERVECMIEECEEVASTAIPLPEVEGDGDGRDQCRADHSNAVTEVC
jgi:hypothetical protein